MGCGGDMHDAANNRSPGSGRGMGGSRVGSGACPGGPGGWMAGGYVGFVFTAPILMTSSGPVSGVLGALFAGGLGLSLGAAGGALLPGGRASAVGNRADA